MAEKVWLTKEQKRLLKPHAEHYSSMFEHIQDTPTEHLEKLYIACLACTTTNCWWAEHAAAQYLRVEIEREIGWRNRRDAEAAELAEPTSHIHGRWADDGGRAVA